MEDLGKDSKTPDLPAVKYKTCREYKEYMEGNHDENSTQKHNPIPEDAMNLAALGNKSDEEVLEIINKMSQMDNKSDIRVMYSNGYGFTWDDLRTIAEFIGATPDGNSRKAIYEIKDMREKDKTYKRSITDEDEGTIYIERGSRKRTVSRKITFSVETLEMLDDLLEGIPSNQDKSKAIDAIMRKSLDEMCEAKKNHRFHIAYKPTEKTYII